MGGRTELDVEAHALGLVRERIHAAADPGLCFGAIRRRLARGHLTPNEPVLVGTWAGKSVLVHVVDRRPELRPHENGVPELYLSVSAEIDPPILAAATLATFGSVRLPTGLSVAKTPVRHHGIARVFHVTAANPERLDAFLGDTDDFAFGDALTTAAGALGDLVVADGLVEVNQPLASRPKLRHLADGVTRVAHLVSERSSRLPDLPALAAWKSEWLALAESQGLAFEGARARIAGSVLGDQVELVVEPAYQHFETVLAVRFRMPLEGPFQLESHVPGAHEGPSWLERLFVPRGSATCVRVRGFDLLLSDGSTGRARLFEGPDVVAALDRLETLGAIVLVDPQMATARARSALSARDASVLLDAVLALSRALQSSARGGSELPYR